VEHFLHIYQYFAQHFFLNSTLLLRGGATDQGDRSSPFQVWKWIVALGVSTFKPNLLFLFLYIYPAK